MHHFNLSVLAPRRADESVISIEKAWRIQCATFAAASQWSPLMEYIIADAQRHAP
jgi:hypothetical protein